MSGWDLAATAQEVIGDFWSLTQSQVYRELARMAERGLIVAGEPEARDRRPYALTDAGRAAFAEWIAEEPGEEVIRFPLLLTLSFGRHLPPERLGSFIATHRAVHARRLEQYEAELDAARSADDADPYALATLEFGATYERAVLDWFARMPEILKP